MAEEARETSLIAAALKRAPLFADLPSSILAELCAMSRIERHGQGKVLYQVGESVAGLYIVATGVLENGLLQAKGRRFVLAYVPPGDFAGMVPTLDEQAALTDIRAHTDVTVVLIPRGPLRASLEREPKLLFRFTLELCQNVRRYGLHIWRLAMLGLRQRCAHALLSLASSYGHSTAAGIDIELKVSQDDLAAMLSVSRQRVNTELRSLVAEGVVKARYSHITILDQKRLAAIAGGR